MNRNTIFYFLTVPVLVMLISGCAVTKTGSQSVAGTWRYELKDMPSDDNSGVMIITQNGKELACHVKTDSGYELDFESFEVTHGSLTSHYLDQGSRVDVSGSFEGDLFTGKAETSGMIIGVTAHRVK